MLGTTSHNAGHNAGRNITPSRPALVQPVLTYDLVQFVKNVFSAKKRVVSVRAREKRGLFFKEND